MIRQRERPRDPPAFRRRGRVPSVAAWPRLFGASTREQHSSRRRGETALQAASDAMLAPDPRRRDSCHSRRIGRSRRRQIRAKTARKAPQIRAFRVLSPAPDVERHGVEDERPLAPADGLVAGLDLRAKALEDHRREDLYPVADKLRVAAQQRLSVLVELVAGRRAREPPSPPAGSSSPRPRAPRPRRSREC
jgi:hypothetical protein